MNVGFFHIDRPTSQSTMQHDCARGLVRSVRKKMPDAKVYQFTDQTSKAVDGVDAVRRKPLEPMALLRMRHHAGVKGEWLFVDTDVLIQQDVQGIFDDPFDIAIARRDWTHVKPAVGFSQRMPYNIGVVFSRCPHFWGEVYTRLRLRDARERDWMGDQSVICEVIDEERPRYDVTFLAGAKYNYPPVLAGVDLNRRASHEYRDARIVHYKGAERKAMMLKRIGAIG